MFNYFEESVKDIIGHLRPLFQQGACYIREDGKVGIKGKNTWDVPWIYTVPERSRDCIIPRQILFPYWGFIPSRCHRCWKVVVRPRTLKEVFALYELQERLGLSSKVGIEDRRNVPAIYGGYFYNDTLDEAHKCKVVVERAVASEISPDIPIYIKRGCTEFEEKFPESRHWRIPPQQKDFEAYLNDRLVLETKKAPQPDFVILNVKRKWVERAYEIGDETYRHFTGGRPLYELTTTY